MRTFTGKMPQTLFEPVQSKRMPRFHKSHFLRKFGKILQTRVSTPSTDLYRKNPRPCGHKPPLRGKTSAGPVDFLREATGAAPGVSQLAVQLSPRRFELPAVKVLAGGVPVESRPDFWL